MVWVKVFLCIHLGTAALWYFEHLESVPSDFIVRLWTDRFLSFVQ